MSNVPDVAQVGAPSALLVDRLADTAYFKYIFENHMGHHVLGGQVGSAAPTKPSLLGHGSAMRASRLVLTPCLFRGSVWLGHGICSPRTWPPVTPTARKQANYNVCCPMTDHLLGTYVPPAVWTVRLVLTSIGTGHQSPPPLPTPSHLPVLTAINSRSEPQPAKHLAREITRLALIVLALRFPPTPCSTHRKRCAHCHLTRRLVELWSAFTVRCYP